MTRSIILIVTGCVLVCVGFALLLPITSLFEATLEVALIFAGGVMFSEGSIRLVRTLWPGNIFEPWFRIVEESVRRRKSVL